MQTCSPATQPILETLEIGMYAGLALLTLLFWLVSASPA